MTNKVGAAYITYMIEIVEKASKKAGGVVALARHLGIKHTSLYSWRRVPAERVLEIEEHTGISRHELRPDIFGPVSTNPAHDVQGNGRAAIAAA